MKAIELDPDFARAHAMLALTYRQEIVNGGIEDYEQALAVAMGLAEKALSLDAALPEAYLDPIKRPEGSGLMRSSMIALDFQRNLL